MKNLDKAVVFKENPNSQETGEVMPGMYYISDTSDLVKDIQKARIWTCEAAAEFCSKRSYDWMMK